MLYPILTVVCLLLRGQLSLQRKDLHLVTDSNKSSNGINTSISSCSVEELSKLLTNRITMTKAIELAAAQQRKTTNEFIHNMFHWAVNKPIKANHDKHNQGFQGNDLHSLNGNLNSQQIPIDPRKFHPISKNHLNQRPYTPNIIHEIGLIDERKHLEDKNIWPFAPSQTSSPLFLPPRSIKPPPGAKVKVEFKDKIREVIINVSPLMSVLEALKQGEIKFQRNLRLPLEDELISFWPSPSLGCVIVDKVSTVESDKSMMWKIIIINKNGEIEYEDFCLPSKEEIFIKPGSTLELVYTSVQMFQDIN